MGLAMLCKVRCSRSATLLIASRSGGELVCMVTGSGCCGYIKNCGVAMVVGYETLSGCNLPLSEAQ